MRTIAAVSFLMATAIAVASVEIAPESTNSAQVVAAIPRSVPSECVVSDISSASTNDYAIATMEGVVAAIEAGNSSAIANVLIAVSSNSTCGVSVSSIIAAVVANRATILSDVISACIASMGADTVAAVILPAIMDMPSDTEAATIEAVSAAKLHNKWYDRYSFTGGTRLWALTTLAREVDERGGNIDELETVFNRLIAEWQVKELDDE